jgi:hypothetical protein
MLVIKIIATKPNRKAKSSPDRNTLSSAGKFRCGIGDTRSDKVTGRGAPLLQVRARGGYGPPRNDRYALEEDQ